MCTLPSLLFLLRNELTYIKLLPSDMFRYYFTEMYCIWPRPISEYYKDAVFGRIKEIEIRIIEKNDIYVPNYGGKIIIGREKVLLYNGKQIEFKDKIKCIRAMHDQIFASVNDNIYIISETDLNIVQTIIVGEYCLDNFLVARNGTIVTYSNTYENLFIFKLVNGVYLKPTHGLPISGTMFGINEHYVYTYEYRNNNWQIDGINYTNINGNHSKMIKKLGLSKHYQLCITMDYYGNILYYTHIGHSYCFTFSDSFSPTSDILPSYCPIKDFVISQDGFCYCSGDYLYLPRSIYKLSVSKDI